MTHPILEAQRLAEEARMPELQRQMAKARERHVMESPKGEEREGEGKGK